MPPGAAIAAVSRKVSPSHGGPAGDQQAQELRSNPQRRVELAECCKGGQSCYPSCLRVFRRYILDVQRESSRVRVDIYRVTIA